MTTPTQNAQLGNAIANLELLHERMTTTLQSEIDDELAAAGIGNVVELYIDNTNSTGVADDNNSGTAAKPLKTLNGLAHKLRGGKTHRVYVMGESLIVDKVYWDFVPAGAVVVFDREAATGALPIIKAATGGFINWRKGGIFLDDVEVLLNGTETSWENSHLFNPDNTADFDTTANTKLTAITGTTRKLLRVQGVNRVNLRGTHTNMIGNYFVGVAAGADIKTALPGVLCNKVTG